MYFIGYTLVAFKASFESDAPERAQEEHDHVLLVPDGRDVDLQPDGVAVLLVVEDLVPAAVQQGHVV